MAKKLFSPKMAGMKTPMGWTPLPYTTRRGLVTTWQETRKPSQDEIWIDNVMGGAEGEKTKTTRIGKRPKTKKKSTPTEERKDEEEDGRARSTSTSKVVKTVMKYWPIAQ